MTAKNSMTMRSTCFRKPPSAKTSQAKPRAKATKKKPQAKKSATRKMSQIDAAVAVLCKAKEPMNCTAILEAIAQQGLSNENSSL